MQNDPLVLARQYFLEGIADFESGRLESAHTCFERALSYAPQRTSVLLNLGVTKAHLKRFEQALPLLSAALQAEPDALDGWMALALCQSELGHWPEASTACERALAINADQVPIHLLYAKSLARQGDLQAAQNAYRQSLKQAPDHAQAWYELGDVQRESGQFDTAAQSYREALHCGADKTLVQYMLSALQKEPPVLDPPRIYVQGLFDQYASDFEEHLVGQLGYCGNSELIKNLPIAPGEKVPRVLDLGCGTGLAAPLLRPRAQYLCGVDLSGAMIEKARVLGLYDQLVVADILEYFLEGQSQALDLVVAADVFIYLGQLERLFEQLSKHMTAAAKLAFTLEAAPIGAGVQLLPSLRYAHAPDYMRHLAKEHGFVVLSMHQAPIRVEQGKPLIGQYWYLQKQVV